MNKVGLIFASLFCSLSMAQSPKAAAAPKLAAAAPVPQVQAVTPTVQESSGYALKEIGISLGTPAALNLSLGFWGTESIPLLVRASGMYYGKVRGFQSDLGLVSNGGGFKPFIAGTLTVMRIETDTVLLDYKGIGPSLGFNLYGFQFQGGLAFPIGSGNFAYNADDGLRSLDKAITLQLGYSFIW